jgi:hypothetical protein
MASIKRENTITMLATNPSRYVCPKQRAAMQKFVYIYEWKEFKTDFE